MIPMGNAQCPIQNAHSGGTALKKAYRSSMLENASRLPQEDRRFDSSLQKSSVRIGV